MVKKADYIERLGSLWMRLYPGIIPTKEDIDRFTIECAYRGADAWHDELDIMGCPITRDKSEEAIK